MQVQWPTKTRKPQFMAVSPSAPSLFVPNRNYVLLRRFSAKEEKRRLVAAPYLQQIFQAAVVGLENHLNYVYRPGGELSWEEVYGLSALFNSRWLDTYFRTLNGHTQVNATDLMHMPLPPLPIIQQIGRCVLTAGVYAPEQVDEIVEHHLTAERATPMKNIQEAQDSLQA
jgi:adenine-specific DNA-methyltransferase